MAVLRGNDGCLRGKDAGRMRGSGRKMTNASNSCADFQKMKFSPRTHNTARRTLRMCPAARKSREPRGMRIFGGVMRANRFGEGRNATITENSYSEASGRLTIRSTERLGMGEGGREVSRTARTARPVS